ncbi:PucR family transcriptional regulator [Nocardia sp. NPDC004415]
MNDDSHQPLSLPVLLARQRAAVSRRVRHSVGDAEYTRTVDACARLLLDLTATTKEPGRGEVARVVVPLAERHAEQRMPAATLLELVQIAARAVLAEAEELAVTPEQRSELADIGRRLLEVTGHVGVVALETYGLVEQEMFGSAQEIRRELLAALLTGAPTRHLATRAELTLAATYTVLAIDLGPNAGVPSTMPELVARRRERVIARSIDELGSAPALLQFDGVTGTALVPDSAETIAADRFDRLAERLADTLDCELFLGLLPEVAPADIPSAVADARELALFPRLRERPSGCYRLDDLLLELQITRPGRAKQRLIQLLEPLAEHPHLMNTLQAHLQHGADRQAAARELHIHPNTFTYRLSRITELTGLDPTQPREGRTLAAALTIRILEPPAAPGTTEPH